MPIEIEVLPFAEWLNTAIVTFLAVAGGVTLFAALATFLVAAVRHGPVRAGDMIYRVLVAGVIDLLRISPRRVFALARLAVQESMRRRVWTVLVVFAVFLIFAAWFLDPKVVEPARLYLSFVMMLTMFLSVLLGLFLSAFSLPADIKNRTIYTVVTKPVRAGEIVLGRILGFVTVGTVLLLIMGLSSYVFIQRALRHEHELTPDDLTQISGEKGFTGQTSLALNHRHPVILDADGNGQTELDAGHWHTVTRKEADGELAYEVGPHQDRLVARVPIRGDITYIERSGQEGTGVNVGNEWDYRKFIEGGTLAAAIWTFDGVTPDRFPDGLPIEMICRVFRTHKGDIERGIRGSLVLVNPSNSSKSSEFIYFTSKDLEVDQRFIPRKLNDSKGNSIDLFEELVDEGGRLQIKLQCLERGQYFGLAEADMWLRAGDRPFWMNFVKGHIGIWLQMLLVVSLGVMFSTFLSGAVAMIATIGTLVMGFFTGFVTDLTTGVLYDKEVMQGGGPIESFIRIITQKNVMTELDDTLGVRVTKMVDTVLMYVMDAVVRVVPNFNTFGNSDYVAYGFNIPGLDIIARNILIALAYAFGFFIAGYFFLKTREVAR